MMNRRQLIGSSLAVGGASLGLTGCGAAPAAAPAAIATGATIVSGIATTAAAISEIVMNTFTSKGAQAKKDQLTILVEHGPDPTQPKLETLARENDTLARLEQIESDLKSLIRVEKPPVLPGRPGPERWYRLTPVIWDGQQRLFGDHTRMVEASEFPNDFTLFSPEYEAHPITRPGLYRVGFLLTTEDGEGELFGGGGFAHVFSPEQWDYDRMIADYAMERPDYLATLTYAVDPLNHVDYAARLTTA